MTGQMFSTGCTGGYMAEEAKQRILPQLRSVMQFPVLARSQAVTEMPHGCPLTGRQVSGLAWPGLAGRRPPVSGCELCEVFLILQTSPVVWAGHCVAPVLIR